jgi:N-acetylneuraminate synthase
MEKFIEIGDRKIGEGLPVYIIGEIGLNHNGDINIAKKLIDIALLAGCDAVKFQKRTPELCVPKDQRDLMRETPWGRMTYMEYRYKVEFGEQEFLEIKRYCIEKGIQWFVSCWDTESVDFMEKFEVPCYKIASASLTDHDLIAKILSTGKPIILSTGMSTMDEISSTVNLLGQDNLIILHCTSSYPSKPEEVNLGMLRTLKNEYHNVPIGYSGHEVGLQISLAAVAMGAVVIERHITVDRTMWGSDQAASVEPGGLLRLVRDIRIIENALGDGVKKVYESERQMINKLRRKV